MSKQVDERIVSMQFDNKNFEKNVSQTMSTLDKFKEKLNLKGASKGLNEVNSAAKKVDMTGLANGVEVVKAKFSAMEVVGITALANITNSAVNAGKRIVSALTIDPIKTGFKEYETQINAVQTILANTQSKGSTIDDVNKALDELNKYADLTIYNFTEMTRNIGTFTAAGIDLETSTNAIKGIANLAAVSGSTSQQASTAMYQLSQALASGSVKLMDWNSVVNAGMSGQVFQDALKETARVHGIAIDNMIEEEGSFLESLKSGWLSSDILTETLQKFTLTTEGLTEEQIKANREMLKAKGYTEDQIEEIFKLGRTATDAATKVKTFTQLWGVLKESAQSGWSQTWKIIIGDFEEAKALLTPLANALTNIIEKMSNARNFVVSGVMDFASPWTALTEKLEKVQKVTKTVTDVTDKLKYFQDIVTSVWRGDYNNHGDNPDRYDLLEAAGYDHRVVQTLVDKGYLYEITIEDIEAAHKKFGLTMETTAEETESVTKAIANLSEETLRNAGLTDEEIRLYNDLAKNAEKYGMTIDELAKEMSETSGRDLFIESFKNIGKSVSDSCKAIGDAWREIFDPVSITNIYMIIKAFRDWTTNLQLVDKETGELNETGKKIKSTFKGLFAALDIVRTIVGGPIRIAFKILTKILDALGLSIWDITAPIGDAIVKFRDWINSAIDFEKIFEKISPYIKNAAEAIRNWVDETKPLEKVGAFFTKCANAIRDWASAIKNSKVAQDIISGLTNGLTNGIPKILECIKNLAVNLINKVKEVLGIHSPSKVFMEIAQNIIDGFVIGIQNGIAKIQKTFQDLANGCIEILKNVPWGTLIAGGMTAGILVSIKNITDTMDKFAAPLEGLGSLFTDTGEGLKKLLTGLGKNFKAKALETKSKALLNLAISIGILAASVYVLSKLDAGTLWSTIGAITVLGAVMVALLVAMDKFGGTVKGKLNAKKMAKQLLSIIVIAGSLMILAAAIKKLSTIDISDVPSVIATFSLAVASLIAMMFAISKLTKGRIGENVQKAGIVLIKMSVALLIMTFVIKIAAGMKAETVAKGLAVITLVEVLFLAVIAVSKLAGEYADKAGTMLLKMSLAFIIMVYVIEKASKLDDGQIQKGIGLMIGLKLLFTYAIVISRLAGKEGNNAGKMLLAMSGAFLIMSLVIRIIGEMPNEAIAKGMIVVTALMILFESVIYVSKFAGSNAKQAGKMLLAMSGALLMLTAVIFIIGLLKPAAIAKSLVVITILEAFFAGLIYVTKYAKDCTKTLIVLSVVITLLVAALVGLSFIDPTRLATAAGSLSAVIGVFALLVYAMQFLKTGEKTYKRNIATLGALVLIVSGLAAILHALSNVSNPEAMIPVAAALSLLMLSLTGCLFILSKVGKNAKQSKTGIIALTAMVIPLIVFAAALAFLPNLNGKERSIVILTATMILMSALLLALVGIGTIMKLVGPAGVVGSIAGLVAMVGALCLFGIAINAIPDISGKERTIVILTATMAAMSVLLLILTGIGALMVLTGGLGPIAGILGLVAMIIPLVAFAIAIDKLPDVTDKIPVVDMLTELMISLTNCLVKVSILGPLALVGVYAVTALGTVIIAFGTLATAIGVLMDSFPQLETFVDKGIDIMIKLARGLGDMISAFMEAISEGIMNSLPNIGTALSMFMINAMPFIAGVKMVDGSVAAGVAILVGAILALTVADFINGIVSFLPMSQGFENLGTKLSNFMKNADGFITSVKKLDESSVKAVKCLAETIMLITATDIIDGIYRFFSGSNESPIDKFSEQLPILGEGVAGFITKLEDAKLSADSVTLAEHAADIICKIADASANIPNSGGWLGAILGENDIGTFGSQLYTLADGIVKFTNKIVEGNITEESVGIVEHAADIIVKLAEAASKIPNSGGWLATIVGDNDMETWSKKLPAVAEGIKGFMAALTTDSEGNSVLFGDEEVALAGHAADVIAKLASAAKDIPNSGGWLASIVGDNSIDTWSEGLPKVGKGVAGFVNALMTIDSDGNASGLTADKLSIVNKALQVVKDISKMTSDYDSKSDKGDFSSFGEGLVTFGTKIKDFVNSLSEITVEKVRDVGNKVLEVIKIAGSMSETNAEAIKTFGENMKAAGSDGIKAFIDALDSEDATGNATKAIDSLMKACSNAVKNDDNKKKFSDAGNKIVESLSKAINSKDNKSSMSGAGKDLIDGLLNGLTDKDKLNEVYNAGFKLGQKAVEGEKDGQQSNSPSKLTTKAGKWLGEGLIIGMRKMLNPVYESGNSLGETATNSISSAISKVYDFMNDDFSAQPTIRPVLDLSEVRSGANSISSMFSGNRTLAISAPGIGTISASMSRRQNGNNDLVSAINKLTKTNNGKSGNTYQINGITYSEGSEVSDAIQTLVRATKIEGRT